MVGASCTDSVRPLVSIRAYNLCANAIKRPCLGEGAVLSALRLIFKSSAFEPPFSLWGRQARMPEGERTGRGTMPRKLSVHKGIENLLYF